MKKIIITFLIGDYLLDEMTKNQRIDMFPRPFAYVRDKILFLKNKNYLNNKNFVRRYKNG